MKISNAKYLTSVVDKNMIIQDGIDEIAFVGRSNVGKSSLINSLCNKKNLAKTSSTPGLTKMINYFDINDGSFRLVDLPGYGFAKVGKSHKNLWSGLIGDYLVSSESLKLVFVLVDSRLAPSELDKLMIEFLVEVKVPFAVIVTKTDKLSKAQLNKSLSTISKDLSLRKEAIFTFSVKDKDSSKALLDYIENLVS